MKIAIIGSGNVGSALGFGWLKSGHSVVFGVRDPQSVKARKALDLNPNATLEPIAKAIPSADVIVITTPPDAIFSILPDLKKHPSAIFIDATNSVRVKPEPFPTVYHALLHEGKFANIAKCFNTTGFENMKNPVYPAGSASMFMAATNESTKNIVKDLAIQLGFEDCYDCGGNDQVVLLEQLALNWINLAMIQGKGRSFAFSVLKR